MGHSDLFSLVSYPTMSLSCPGRGRWPFDSQQLNSGLIVYGKYSCIDIWARLSQVYKQYDCNIQSANSQDRRHNIYINMVNC
jgi:hypothetical protein